MTHLNSLMNDFPDKIKEVRGKGLLTAFEMHDDPMLDGHAVSVGLLNQGVYAKETHHTTVRLAPALTTANGKMSITTSSVVFPQNPVGSSVVNVIATEPALISSILGV